MEDVQADRQDLKFSPEAEAHLDALEKEPDRKSFLVGVEAGLLAAESEKPRCKKCFGEGRLRSVACDHEGCYGSCGRTIECRKCEGTGEEGGKKAVEPSTSLIDQIGARVSRLEEAALEMLAELDLTRRLYSRSLQERLRLKNELNAMPPVDLDVLRKCLAYSFRPVTSYALLTREEKAFLTEADYTALRNWALKE